MKKSVKVLIIISSILILYIIAFFVCGNLFGTFYPIPSSIGAIQIVFTDKEYTTIQKRPSKVMISKSTSNNKSAQEMLDNYMAESGFITTDRLGSLITYSDKDGNTERVHFSVNKYYSLWEWI